MKKSSQPSGIIDEYTISYLQSIPEAEAIGLLRKYYSFKAEKLNDILDEIGTQYKTKTIKSLKTCPQCNSNDVISREVQLRSADEGMTMIYICNHCGKSF
jgi:DNA-directed RNA polymerase subunit M/transcription elongation factor TFIIS